MLQISYLLTHICNLLSKLVDAVEKCPDIAVIYCSGHNVGDDFVLTGKEFDDSAVGVSRLNEMKVNYLGCCGTRLMLIIEARVPCCEWSSQVEVQLIGYRLTATSGQR